VALCIFPLRPEQLLRLGARTALQPLQPFTGRTYHNAPWDLTRAPRRAEPRAPMRYPRLANIHLGHDETAPPAATAPERVSYVLTIDRALTAGNVFAVTTPALPAPCTIQDVDVTDYTVGTATCLWQLLLVDEEYAGLITPDTGEPLLLANATSSVGVATTARLKWGVPSQATVGSTAAPTRQHIGPLGRLVTQPGTRLAFAVRRHELDRQATLTCIVTVERHQAH